MLVTYTHSQFPPYFMVHKTRFFNILTLPRAKAQVIPALSITVIVTPFGSFLTMSTGLLVRYRPYLPYF